MPMLLGRVSHRQGQRASPDDESVGHGRAHAWMMAPKEDGSPCSRARFRFRLKGRLDLTMPTPEHWSVTIALPPGDVEILRFAVPTVVPAERHAIVTETWANGQDGASELVVDVLADSQMRAIGEATAIYQRARLAAGLPLADAEIVGLLPPIFAGQVYDLLWDEANQLFTQGRYELAVVRAQTACECLARFALEGMVRGRVGQERGYLAEAIVPLLRAALNDARTQQFISATTGGSWKATQQPWWSDYTGPHMRRRNGIVHHGLTVTPQDAAASLAAVESCMDWLRQLWSEG
jgi:hypothetical protein